MKTVVIHQPDFLSYLGYYHRLLHADLFVLLDTVQFVNRTSRSWTNRDKIKTANGEKWLTVSVVKAPMDTPIRDILLSRTADWRNNNLNLIRENYQRAQGFTEVFPYLESLYAFDCDKLIDLNFRSIEILRDLLDISIPMVFASQLGVRGTGNELLVNILKNVGATHYLSGVGARAYFDAAPFDLAGINVRWQVFNHPVYPQLHGPFIPGLSSIDLLLNCGVAEARRILREAK